MIHENQRYFIYGFWKVGRNATQIHNELVIIEGEQALSLSTVRRRTAAFEEGEEQIVDRPRSGRPCEAVTPEKIAKIEDLITDDPA